MDLKLRDKRALVTGSTAGIGLAIARGLARERAEVIVNGRSEEKVGEAVRRITAETGANAVGIATDLSNAEGVNRLLDGMGRVDILINNVGIFEPVPFLDISDQDWFRFFEVNVMSGVRLARALLPQMLERNWGRVIFIGRADSGRNGALRTDQDGATRADAGHRGERCGDRRHSECRIARADPLRRGGRDPRQGRDGT
jgi:NAD(P)-dependent dehydrogenase (short-subunit alcohol dehydrogenase family)